MTKEVKETEQLSVAEQARLAMSQVSEQATIEQVKEERAKENKTFVKIETLDVSAPKEYTLRVLPTKPEVDGSIRATFSYPIHTRWLSVNTPTNKTRNVMIVKPSYCGITGDDPLEVFNTAAKKIASDTKDNELNDFLSHFKTTLDYRFEELAYVLDCANREKGLQLYRMSFTQRKDIHNLHISLWEQLRESDKDALCPFTNPNGAYRLILNKTDGKYAFTQSATGNDKLTDEEIEKWFETPSIPETQYVYNRYMLTGLVAALEQIDADFELGITETEEFRNAVNNIDSQLDPNDTSVFQTGDENDNDDGGESGGAVQLNDLFDEADAIEEKGLGKESDEAANLRTQISKFIEQEELDVKITVRKTNDNLLDEIAEAVENKTKVVEKPASRRRRR